MDEQPLEMQTDSSPPKDKHVTRFAMWLQKQLDDKGWSRSEMARRGGISASMLDKVINGFGEPGLDTCRGVAKALKIPLEDVLRLAGILPPVVGRDDTTRDLVARLDNLQPSVRERLLRIWEANLDMASELSSQVDDLKELNQLLGTFPVGSFEDIRRLGEAWRAIDEDRAGDEDPPENPADPPATDDET